jgi:hypothetical protein
VPNDSYKVTLKFAEIHSGVTVVGQRVFNGYINNNLVLNNFDIIGEVGQFVVDDKVFHNIAPDANGNIVVKLTSGSAGIPRISALEIVPESATPVPTPTPSVTPYFQVSNGQVAIEAEHYNTRVDLSSHWWAKVLGPTGVSGTALKAMPDNGANYDTNYAQDAPRLDYHVNFTNSSPATYYVWIRGYAVTDGDSIHVGYDGISVPTSDRIQWSTLNSWTWTNSTMDTVRAYMVMAPGVHTINVWMREDGGRIDQIFLTTNNTTNAPSSPSENLIVTLTPTPAQCPFDTDSSPNYRVVMEAEHYDNNVKQSNNDYWDPMTGPSGVSGTCLRALPDDGTDAGTGYSTASAQLDYAVDFESAGNYYVWLLGYPGDSNSDTAYIGVDGVEQSTNNKITWTSYNAWGWKGSASGAPASIYASAGVHTVNVWMKKDGLYLDRVLLTKSTSTPSGTLTENLRCGGSSMAMLLRPTPRISPTATVEPRELRVVAAPNVSRNGQPVNIRYTLGRPAKVTLSIVTLMGEKVFSVAKDSSTGDNELVWDVKNSSHSAVASGLYLYVLEVDDGSSKETRKGKIAVFH